MWANNKSCHILFWHVAQRRCTSNPAMNFHGNPDDYNARRCPKQPIKPGWGDMNLVNEVQRKTRPPTQNQFKYKLHKLNAQTHIISISLTPSPSFRTLKSHNRFPFSSNSELPENKKMPLLILIFSVKGKQRSSLKHRFPGGETGQMELLWHDLVWVSPLVLHSYTEIQSWRQTHSSWDTLQRPPR